MSGLNRTSRIQAPSNAGHSHGGSVADEQQYAALMQKHEQLRNQRMRRQVELEGVEREIAACVEEARALGVGSLEELEALLARQEAEDRAEQERFARELAEEEALLRRIEDELAGESR